jgi:hypothetical protein
MLFILNEPLIKFIKIIKLPLTFIEQFPQHCAKCFTHIILDLPKLSKCRKGQEDLAILLFKKRTQAISTLFLIFLN